MRIEEEVKCEINNNENTSRMGMWTFSTFSIANEKNEGAQPQHKHF